LYTSRNILVLIGVLLTVGTKTFSVNFDYRCPFARNANEHVVAALHAGAPFDVRFSPFSLSVHGDEDREFSVWEDPDRRDELTALAAGLVVRDRFPEHFLAAHLSLFAARHDDGEDLRNNAAVRTALERGEVDADLVLKELEDGWPFETLREEHEASVRAYDVWGVPTFIVADRAVFIRLLTRPTGDPQTSVALIETILSLICEHPELNEFKYTTIPN
jgi:hypothetical protein